MTSNLVRHGWWFRQLPNLITLVRIALVPLVLWLLLAHWDSVTGRLLALIAFVLAAATDGLDGGLARKFSIESSLGKLLDPIADKFLLGGTLVALSFLGAVNWWVTVLILCRELGITVYRLIVARRRVIPASAGGKFKTVLQIVVLALVILPLEAVVQGWNLITQVLLWLAVGVTLYTGYRYLRPSNRPNESANSQKSAR